MRVVVVGAGMGGLAASLAARRAGHDVLLLEAGDGVGGLARGVTFDGVDFDGGPYVLLDRPGLAWAFAALGLDLDAELDLVRLEHAWRVTWDDGDAVDLWGDLDRTAEGLEARERGSADRYRAFVRRAADVYARLAPLQRRRAPTALDLLARPSRWSTVPFLLRPLGVHLADTELPLRVQDALGIWSHVAGQPTEAAPAPLAMVPAIVHRHGAWVVRGGLGRVPEVLADAARRAGVEVRLGARVDAVTHAGRRVTGVRVDGVHVEADAVVGNAPALAILTEQLDPPVPALAARWADLPLQGPGVAACLTASRRDDVPYLTFRLGRACTLRIASGAVDPSRADRVRLLRPLPHGVSDDDAHAALDDVLGARWWREGLDDVVLRGVRTPAHYAARAHLFRESMNPAMTQAFLRRGRMPHVLPELDGLVLAGSATHPGQWVSFCAISGVLAAGALP